MEDIGNRWYFFDILCVWLAQRPVAAGSRGWCLIRDDGGREFAVGVVSNGGVVADNADRCCPVTRTVFVDECRFISVGPGSGIQRQAVGKGVFHQLGVIGEFEFFQNPGAVGAHGFDTQEHPRADVG